MSRAAPDPMQAYLDERRGAPFEWGAHDCAMFAAGWYDLKRGGNAAQDFVRSFRVRSAREYRALLRKGKLLPDLVSEVLGSPSQYVVDERLQSGDIVLVGSGRRAALGIAAPPVVLVAASRGICPVPLSAVTKVWRID